jgi:hypothetical protein
MRAAAILGSSACALLGAIIWGLISWGTGYEVGYIAWGIGLVVGLAAAALGARGTTAGLMCGAFALLAIAGGKLLAIELQIRDLPSQLQQEAQAEFTRELYDELAADAKALKELPDESAYPKFMQEKKYVEGEPTAEDIEYFKSTVIPELETISSGKLSFEDWQNSRVEFATAAMIEGIDRNRVFMDSLSPYDLLWAFLGVVTAYQIARKGKGDGPAANSEQTGEQQLEGDELANSSQAPGHSDAAGDDQSFKQTG